MDKALAKLKALRNVYQDSIEVKVGKELSCTLRLLSSQEETEVHSYAMSFEQGIAYLYAVKRDTLCRAITKLNGTDVPEFVEDDEQGKVEKYLWLRDNVVGGWSQILIDEIWIGYAKLLEDVEVKITGGIKREEKEEETKENE